MQKTKLTPIDCCSLPLSVEPPLLSSLLLPSAPTLPPCWHTCMQAQGLDSETKS